MNITEVRIIKIIKPPKGNLNAIASITLNGEFAIHEIKVLKNNKGDIFIKFPSNRLRNGVDYNVAHPITKEARDAVKKAVIEKYLKCS